MEIISWTWAEEGDVKTFDHGNDELYQYAPKDIR